MLNIEHLINTGILYPAPSWPGYLKTDSQLKCNSNTAVSRQLGIKPCGLTRCQLVHATIVALVHEFIYHPESDSPLLINIGSSVIRTRTNRIHAPRPCTYPTQQDIRKQERPQVGCQQPGRQTRCTRLGRCGSARPSARFRRLGCVRG